MASMIKEIAEKAQVSTATVSRILNGKSSHSPMTVRNVERAMEELGLGSMHTGSAIGCVGLVLQVYEQFLLPSYTCNLVSGVMESLFKEGVLVQVIPVTAGRLSAAYIQQIVESYNLKGLIIQEFAQLYTISRQLSKMPIPVVCIADIDDAKMCHSIRSDSEQAGRDAANYLWSLGHRDFGVITMSRRDLCQTLRLKGFQDCIRELGGNADILWNKEYFHLTDTVTAAAVELFNARKRPSAIFSTNSFMALKLMQEFSTLKLQVPEDISLVSIEEGGELANLPVPVTVIAQPAYRMGALAVSMLVDLMRGIPVDNDQILGCNLIVRKSTQPPKVS